MGAGMFRAGKWGFIFSVAVAMEAAALLAPASWTVIEPEVLAAAMALERHLTRTEFATMVQNWAFGIARENVFAAKDPKTLKSVDLEKVLWNAAYGRCGTVGNLLRGLKRVGVTALDDLTVEHFQKSTGLGTDDGRHFTRATDAKNLGTYYERLGHIAADMKVLIALIDP
jgi:hypothetical protein